MKIVIGGSRTYTDYSFLAEMLDFLLSEFAADELTILSGHCKGVDLLAERYAEERNVEVVVYPAEWEKYGRAAGPIRNKTMVDNCDLVIAFWDGKSKGTKSLIEYARKIGREFRIVDIN